MSTNIDVPSKTYKQTIREAINKDPFFAATLPESLGYQVINDAYSEGWRPIWASGRRSNNSINNLFITINPDTKKVSLKDFIKKITQITTWKCFDKCTYAFEQRGSDPLTRGIGYHVHIVANINIKPSIVKRRLLNSLKGIIGNPKHCDIQHLKDTSVQRKLDYIQGKKGEEKQQKVDQDTPWREEHQLEALYVS